MKTGILVKQSGNVEIIKYNDTLEELQKIVGGYIQYFNFAEGLAIIMDEEGKLKGKDTNLVATGLVNIYPYDIIVGDILIVGINGEDNISLNDESIKTIIEKIERNK